MPYKPRDRLRNKIDDVQEEKKRRREVSVLKLEDEIKMLENQCDGGGHKTEQSLVTRRHKASSYPP